MPRHQVTNQEFLESLNEQLYFLESSILSYSDVEFEAKRVSITIRILVHDTGNSISLLKSLNQKSNLKFINSASPNDGRLHSMTGMVGVRKSNRNQYFGLVAKVNKDKKMVAVPLFQQHLPEWYESYTKLGFQDWWEMEIIKINGIGITRRELILNVANKDGGAHIDHALPEKYHEVKNSSLILNIRGIETKFERNVVYASVVQIGWELLNSIKKEN